MQKFLAFKSTVSVFLGTTPTSEVTKDKQSQTAIVEVEKQAWPQEVISTVSSNEFTEYENQSQIPSK